MPSKVSGTLFSLSVNITNTGEVVLDYTDVPQYTKRLADMTSSLPTEEQRESWRNIVSIVDWLHGEVCPDVLKQIKEFTKC